MRPLPALRLVLLSSLCALEKPCAEATRGQKGSLNPKQFISVINNCYRYHLCVNGHLWGRSHLCNDCGIGIWIEPLGSLYRKPLRSPAGTQQRSKPTSVCMYMFMPKPGTQGAEIPNTSPTLQDWYSPDATRAQQATLQCSSLGAVTVFAQLSLIARTHQHSHAVPVPVSLRNSLEVTVVLWASQTPCL